MFSLFTIILQCRYYPPCQSAVTCRNEPEQNPKPHIEHEQDPVPHTEPGQDLEPHSQLEYQGLESFGSSTFPTEKVNNMEHS